MKWQQVAERIVWTAVQAAIGNVTVAAVFDVAFWKMGLASAAAAALAAVSIVARRRLAILPDPGDGLPGAEVSPRNGPG